ncbi:MAG: NDP-sugar synthase [Thermodesulfobacteriota bacterium]
MKAIILAGGKGRRLRPYTFVLPKPLIPVGNSPVIELLLKWLRRNGITNVCITIGYLGHLIRSLCGDGSQWEMEVSYSEEPEPLGTMGPLLLIRDQLKETFLVVNGDLVTDLDIRAFTSFHKEHGGLMTVAVTEKNVKVDLGVLETEGSRVKTFREKPVMKFYASMGLYCVEPGILSFIPKGVPFGFDDLMYAMIAQNVPVYTYRHEGLWMDLGRQEDFASAQEVLGE